MQTVIGLYNTAKKSAYQKNTVKINISLCDLGILLNYTEGVGVKSICDKHTAIMQTCKQKAAKLRYHNVANSILPDDPIIYDSRYADVLDIGDWEL